MKQSKWKQSKFSTKIQEESNAGAFTIKCNTSWTMYTVLELCQFSLSSLSLNLRHFFWLLWNSDPPQSSSLLLLLLLLLLSSLLLLLLLLYYYYHYCIIIIIIINHYYLHAIYTWVFYQLGSMKKKKEKKRKCFE